MEGETGNFKVKLRKKPRYVREDKCTGCNTCTEYCPVQYPDEFNQDISNNKAIHIYYSQAIPLITYIDENCLYLKEEKCRICEAVCQNEAIDFNQTEEIMEISVGAVILAPGYEEFDPKIRADFGAGRYDNVITSMDYERLTDSTGPYEGQILRPSDLKPPQKVAWIQCVGSRQVNPPGANSYCSSVCCTYTQKQVILTKEHDPETECTVFHNDIRSFGKDFERFFQRAEELPDVRFIRSYVSVTGKDPETENVIIKYTNPEEGVKEEEFDLVILSVGLNPPPDVEGLAKKFGLELNDHGFCKTNPVNPMETSRPGFYVSGAFQGPLEIPETVVTASGAGSQCGELLSYRKGDLSVERVYPPEKDVSLEEPRIGVFVCHCGANIGRVVNVPSTVDYALTLPNVVYAQEQLFSCATNSAEEITEMIKEKDLNRVIVAACSPRTLEMLFRDTLREAGLNQYYYEMANIREHCSWVHPRQKDEANQKAKDIIRMAVARTHHLEPLMEIKLPVDKKALVVGGGVAGMSCALSIAEQGHQVYLVERETELGGTARQVYETLEGLNVQAFLSDLIKKVYRHPLIHVYTGAEITGTAGYIGNFTTKIQSTRGNTEVKHGATVIATGADVYTPTEYLYGEDDRVMTHLELEEKIATEDEMIAGAETIVMIQCVGCRNEDRNYCSRICCNESVKNALQLKEKNPERDVYILFRDMRTYGYNEDYYREAAGKGVVFIRYEPEQEPQLEPAEEEGRPVIKVTLPDYVLQKNIELDADVIALAAAVIPSAGTREVENLFKVGLNPDGFFKEAHVKLRPLEFSAEGVYLCGIAHYPKMISETISQAYGAAGRVLALLSNDIITASGAICEVDKNKCVTCGACIDACAYGAIEFEETDEAGLKAAVNPVLCKGDGLCNAVCPTGAIQLKHFTDEELLSQIDAVVPEEEVAETKETAV